MSLTARLGIASVYFAVNATLLLGAPPAPISEADRVKAVADAVSRYKAKRTDLAKSVEGLEARIRNNVSADRAQLARIKAKLAELDRDPFGHKAIGSITEKTEPGKVAGLASKRAIILGNHGDGTLIEFGYEIEGNSFIGNGFTTSSTTRSGVVRCLVVPSIAARPMTKVMLSGLYRVDSKMEIDGKPTLVLQSVTVKKEEMPK